MFHKNIKMNTKDEKAVISGEIKGLWRLFHELPIFAGNFVFFPSIVKCELLLLVCCCLFLNCFTITLNNVVYNHLY